MLMKCQASVWNWHERARNPAWSLSESSRLHHWLDHAELSTPALHLMCPHQQAPKLPPCAQDSQSLSITNQDLTICSAPAYTACWVWKIWKEPALAPFKRRRRSSMFLGASSKSVPQPTWQGTVRNWRTLQSSPTFDSSDIGRTMPNSLPANAWAACTCHVPSAVVFFGQTWPSLSRELIIAGTAPQNLWDTDKKVNTSRKISYLH